MRIALFRGQRPATSGQRLVLRLTLLLLLLASGPLATSAQAQNRSGSFNLSPMVGGTVFEGNMRLKDRPVYSLALGLNLTSRFGVEGVAGLIETEVVPFGSPEVDLRFGRLDLLYHFRPERRFVPYLAAGAGIVSLKVEGVENDDEDLQFNYGAGFKYFVSPSVALRGDVRHLVQHRTNNKNTPRDYYNQLTWSGGLTLQLGGRKAAPQPRPADPVAAPSPLAEEKPALLPELPPVARDSDGDGIPDDRDKCPKTVWGGVNADGCPKDSDGDGVEDERDACPGTPTGMAVDERGCPTLRLAVQFTSGRLDIDPRHHAELAKAAEFIKSQPGGYFLVEGHTDSVGPADRNERLSWQRAESVRRHLIDQFGIAPERLRARGVGESRPIADNATQEGRLRNRRVEITFVPEP